MMGEGPTVADVVDYDTSCAPNTKTSGENHASNLGQSSAITARHRHRRQLPAHPWHYGQHKDNDED